MLAVNYSNLRENMKEYFDRITDGFETMIVTRKKSNVVIMSEESYNSLMETVYLLQNKANHEHLSRSINEYKKGMVTSHALLEDDK